MRNIRVKPCEACVIGNEQKCLPTTRTAKAEYQRAWAVANRDKRRAAQHRHLERYKDDPIRIARKKECAAEWHREWRSNLSDEGRARLLAKDRAWREKNPESVRATKRRTLLKKYGLTEQSFEALWEGQQYACAACGEQSPPNIDHCHKTGEVRGLLCRPCNVALGHAEEDPSRLRALADYIERTGGAL